MKNKHDFIIFIIIRTDYFYNLKPKYKFNNLNFIIDMMKIKFCKKYLNFKFKLVLKQHIKILN